MDWEGWHKQRTGWLPSSNYNPCRDHHSRHAWLLSGYTISIIRRPAWQIQYLGAAITSKRSVLNHARTGNRFSIFTP